MLSSVTKVLVVLALGLMIGNIALADVNDEIAFDYETEGQLSFDLNDEISKQERQIEVILKSFDSQDSEAVVLEDQDPSKVMTVTLVSKKQQR